MSLLPSFILIKFMLIKALSKTVTEQFQYPNPNLNPNFNPKSNPNRGGGQQFSSVIIYYPDTV